MRLSRWFRRCLYAALGTLFISGAAWWVLDRLRYVDGASGWQAASPWLLMLHGGAAMLALLLLGALGPLHVRAAWRRGRNRATGVAMLVVNGALIATAFGLYYLGSKAVRDWTSTLHIGLGLGLPILLLAHVLWGRTTRLPLPSRSRP